MAPLTIQRRDELQFGLTLPAGISAELVLVEIPKAMERCARIAKVRNNFDRAMWLGLITVGTVWGADAILGGAKVQALSRVRKPALIAMGGITAAAAIGKFTTGMMLQRCSDGILDQLGAKPGKLPVYAAPYPDDGLIDPDERSITNYGVSAEVFARQAISPTTIAKGILVVAAATALAAVSAGLSVIGFRGSAVTPGFGITVDNTPDLLGHHDNIL